MEWENINKNYHIKYEDYFILLNNVLCINHDKYYLKDYNVKMLKVIEEAIEFKYLYEPSKLLYEMTFIICPQPKEPVKNYIKLEVMDIIPTDNNTYNDSPHFITIKDTKRQEYKCQMCKINKDFSQAILKKDSNKISHYEVKFQIICLDRSVFDNE